MDLLEEIRLRSNGSIALKFGKNQEVLDEKITYRDILETYGVPYAVFEDYASRSRGGKI